MSSAQWYDTNGHEVLNGTLVGGGGGSQPGVGDWVAADISNAQTIPNDGTPTVIAFDDGVQGGGAGEVTLSPDFTTLQFAAPGGQYVVAAWLQFDATDPTGVRSIQLRELTGAVASAFPQNDIPGADGDGNTEARAAVSWPVSISPAGGTVKVAALVVGAAGAVDVTYGFVSAVKVAALGS